MSRTKPPYEITIPYCYVWMTEGYENRGQLFKGYVEGYVSRVAPGYRLVKIKGMKAICARLNKDS
ncbi:hypothetical protein [Bacillus sp. FJAT-45350]|uniref:hypothetical protein n=1 Tax=Bacillus sp. FJAT-45350 TaxID=2011014 RepID=UPI000BB7D637|nr:hypothetical protein [Bacillus sp. FJAT-45350]